jgi:branched-chain amino acid transport system substrate-binding protein
MRSPLLIVVAILGVLSGCNTASNMTHEVGSWFNPDAPKGRSIGSRAASNVNNAPATSQNGEQNAGEDIPQAVPSSPVTSEPLTNKAAPEKKSAVVKVGLLLPLSGKNAALGKSFQDAAQLAVNDLSADNFELIPKDSGANAGDLSRAVNDAMGEGAQLIIGPIFSDRVADVKTVVAGKVPVLALSNDANVAGNGTYVLGFSPAQQVQRALRYAADKGVSRIAILAPSSIYGDIVVNAANASGMTIVETQRYTSDKASIKKAVAAISAKRGDIQAIVLPEGGATLGLVAAELTTVALSAHDMSIIGTGLWDEQNVQQYPVLIGGFYAAPDPTSRAKFVSHYQKVYGAKPVRLATLAYDATALAAVMARRGQSYDESSLTNPNGFAGLDGLFRLTAQGIAERGLAVLEVTASGAKVVSDAPKSF